MVRVKNLKLISLNDFLIGKEQKIRQNEILKKEKSLVEYQKKFNEGKITSEGEKNNKYIFLKLEGNVSMFRKHWLISVDDISEVSQHAEIAKIGYINNYIVGISNFKGNVCTVIDMSILLNSKPSFIESNSCVLLRKNEGLALLWPKIEISSIEMEKIDIEEYKDNKLYERVAFAKEYYRDNAGNIWNKLDIDQLLQSKPIIDGSNINDFV